MVLSKGRSREEDMENTKTKSNRLKIELALWTLGSLVAAIYAYFV